MKRKSLAVLIVCLLPVVLGGQTDWQTPADLVVTPSTPQPPGTLLTLTSNQPVFVENGTITVVGYGELPYAKVSDTEAETATPYIDGGGNVTFSVGGLSADVAVEEAQAPPMGAQAYLDQVKAAIVALAPAMNHMIDTVRSEGNYDTNSYEYQFTQNMKTVTQEFAQEESDYLTTFFTDHPDLLEPVVTVFYNNGLAANLENVRNELYNFSVDGSCADKTSCNTTTMLIAAEVASRVMLQSMKYGGAALAAGAGIMLMEGITLETVAAFVGAGGLIFATLAATAKTVEMMIPSHLELDIEVASTTMDTYQEQPFAVFMLLGTQDNTFSDIVDWLINLGGGGGWITDFFVKNQLKFSQKLTQLGTDPSLPFSGIIARTGVETKHQAYTIDPGLMARAEPLVGGECNEGILQTFEYEGQFTLTVTVSVYWKTVTKSIAFNIDETRWATLNANRSRSAPFILEGGDGIFHVTVSGTHTGSFTETTTEHNYQDVCADPSQAPAVQTINGTIRSRAQDMYDPLPPVLDGTGCLSGQLRGAAAEYEFDYYATRNAETNDGILMVPAITMKMIAIHADYSECVWHTVTSAPETYAVNWDMDSGDASSLTPGFGFWRMNYEYCPFCAGGVFSTTPATGYDVDFDVEHCG